MRKLLQNVWRFLFKKLTVHAIAIMLAINIVIVGCMCYTNYNMTITLKYIERYLDIQVAGQHAQIMTLFETIRTLTEATILGDIAEAELIDRILKKIKDLQRIDEDIKAKIKDNKTLDLPNVEEMKRANLIIHNLSAGYGGSGTHIRIGNKDYILSCAHLIKNPNDCLLAVENETGKEIVLDLVHYDKHYDLSLFRMKTSAKHIPALEISDIYPEVGSEVIVVGNPSMFEDVVTDGTIAKIKNKAYMMTNKVYCGNSGGAVLYRGKIVGVLSAMQIMWNFPQLQNYSIAINLKSIKRFLEDCDIK